MKTMTLALLFVAAVGCGKDKKETTVTTKTTTDSGAVTDTKTKETPRDVTGNTQVSGGLSIGTDIAAACGIKALEGPVPQFDYDAAELSPEDKSVLDQIATCLISGPLKGKAVDLIGRADPRGTDEYNLGLGARRSNAVNAYLVRLGVPNTQLGASTRGELEATGTDEAGWQKDRRVDIMLAVTANDAAEG